MTARYGARKESMSQKGHLSQFLCKNLRNHRRRVKTQLIKLDELCVMTAKKVDMIPIEVIVRNIATGSIVCKFPFEDKTPLNPPLIQMDFKDDEYHDLILNNAIAKALKISTQEELDNSDN